jgi:hypothetical protein
MDPAPPLDCRRNRIAQWLCNRILNTLATQEYRDIIEGAIVLGFRYAAANKRADGA